jgi:lipoprotein-releasing system permease protein
LSIAWFIAQKISGFKGGGFTALIVKICIATTGISLAVMTIAMALIHGFQEEITHKIYHFWGHVTVTDVEITEQYAPVPMRASSIDLEKIMTIPKEMAGTKTNDATLTLFKSSQGFILYPGIIKKEEDFEGIQLKGADTSFHPSFFDTYLTEGKVPNWIQANAAESREMVVSEYTARRLDIHVGDSLDVIFLKETRQVTRRFVVCGMYKTGLEEYDKKIALINAHVLRQILQWSPDEYAGFELFLHDVNDLPQAVDLLYDEYLPVDYLPVSIRSRFPAIFEWLDLQDYNRILIIFLMVIVCVFNISTAVIVLIIERKRMIGVLKTLGLPFSSIQMVFVFMSLRIVIWATLIGNAVGLALCYLQDRFQFIRLNEADYYLPYAPVSIPWDFWIVLNLGFIFLIGFVLLIPASFIQRISIVKVLHYQ